MALQPVQNCVPKVQKLVEQLNRLVLDPKSQENGIFWELEVRLGQITENNFQPGTSYGFFKSALHWFETCTEWAAVQDWTEVHEFYYRVDRRMVRTTKTFGDTITMEHKWKQKKERHNFFCRRDCIPVSHHSPDLWPDFRVEMSSEQPVQGSVPEVVNTSLVRIKQRKSFFYRYSTDSSQVEPLWRYDFTRCWGGQTMSEAEQNQRSSSTVEPRYEIEIELANPMALVQQYTPDYISKSLLLKTKDLYVPSVWETLSVHRNLNGIEFYFEPQ